VKATGLIPAVAAGTLVFAACGGGSASNTASDTAPPAADEPELVDTEAPADAAATPAETPAPTESEAVEPAATDPAPADEAVEETAAEPAADPIVVPASLQFSAPLVGGGELDAASLAGKPTVFWFWAPN
jgi:hypothetical protein